MRLRETCNYGKCGGSAGTGGLGEMCSGLFGDCVVLLLEAVAVVIPIVVVGKEFEPSSFRASSFFAILFKWAQPKHSVRIREIQDETGCQIKLKKCRLVRNRWRGETPGPRYNITVGADATAHQRRRLPVRKFLSLTNITV